MYAKCHGRLGPAKQRVECIYDMYIYIYTRIDVSRIKNTCANLLSKKLSVDNLKTCFQATEIQPAVVQWITSYLWGLHFLQSIFGLGFSVGHVEREPWVGMILEWTKWTARKTAAAGQPWKTKHQFSKTKEVDEIPLFKLEHVTIKCASHTL